MRKKTRKNRIIIAAAAILVLVLIAAVVSSCNTKEIFVYFNSKGGSECAPIKTKGKETLTLPVPEREGYIFRGWYYDDGILYSPFTERSLEKTKLRESLTVYAKWERKSNPIDPGTPVDRPVDVSEYPYPALTAENGNIRNIQFISFSAPKQSVAGMMENTVARWLYTLNSSTSPQVSMKVNGTATGDIANNLKKGKTLFEFTKTVGSEIYTYTFEVYVIEGSNKDGIEYAFHGDKAFILKMPSSAHLVIPDKIDEKTVSYLAPLSIAGNSIREISIPGSLEYIAEEALSLCAGITNIRVSADNPNFTSGSGALYNKSQTTLIKYYGPAEFTCPATVREIMPYAFYGSLAEEVALPSQSVYLNARAFYGSASLKNVNGLNSVSVISKELFALTSLEEVTFNEIEAIHDRAFAGTKLTSVTIPVGINFFGDNIFENCTALATVTLPSSMTEIPRGFLLKSGITSFTANTTLAEIGDYAFYECALLSEVHLNEGLTAIGESAFEKCSALTSVTLPDTLTSMARAAFRSTALTKVTLPESLTVVETYAFSACNLGEVTMHGMLEVIKSSAFSQNVNLTSIDIPESVREIGNGAFYGTGLKFVFIPASVITISLDAFSGISGLVAYIEHAQRPAGWNEFWTGSATPKYWGVSEIGLQGDFNYYKKDGKSVITKYTGSESNVVIPENLGDAPVAEIGKNAFSNTAADIASVAFESGSNFKTIQEYAFSSSRIAEIYLPESIELIGEYAFYGSLKLEKVNFAALQATDNPVLTGIGKYAFSGCASLWRIGQTYEGGFRTGIPVSLTQVSEGAFSMTAITVFYLHSGITSIGEAAFKQCENLTNIVLDSNSQLSSIGEAAFMQCGNLQEITLPVNITIISDRAFQYCSQLASVTFLGAVTEIGIFAFSGCSNLNNISFPSSLVTIKREAFSNCSAITSLVFGSALRTIGTKAFYNCASIASVRIPASVTTVESQAFAKSGTTGATIYCQSENKPQGFADGWNGTFNLEWGAAI